MREGITEIGVVTKHMTGEKRWDSGTQSSCIEDQNENAHICDAWAPQIRNSIVRNIEVAKTHILCSNDTFNH